MFFDMKTLTAVKHRPKSRLLKTKETVAKVIEFQLHHPLSSEVSNSRNCGLGLVLEERLESFQYHEGSSSVHHSECQIKTSTDLWW